MAATYWTLEYSGTEKTFQDWGFAEPIEQKRDGQPSTFTVRVPGVANLIADPPVPYFGQVIIRKDRGGAFPTFTGGTVRFVGRQTTDRGTASRSPAETLTFSDALHELANLTFQQQWKYNASGTMTSGFFSRVVLFQNYAARTIVGGPFAGTYVRGALIPNGLQIQDILQFAITSGHVNLQIGTIDPVMNLPLYPAKCLSCLSAIQICLKPQPDAVIYIDHTTLLSGSPCPTIHVLAPGSRTPLTLPYASSPHGGGDIFPRYDLQVSQVVFQYKKEVTTDDVTDVAFGHDAYPAIGAYPLDGLAVGTLVVAIDLQGSKVTTAKVLVESAAFNPTVISAGGAGDWWSRKHPPFKDTAKMTGVSIVSGSVTVTKDDHGVAAVAVHSGGGGSGYVVGDILIVAGGTFTQAATILVTSVSGGGGITGVAVNISGNYSANPTLSGNSPTGGSGTGASLDLTMDSTLGPTGLLELLEGEINANWMQTGGVPVYAYPVTVTAKFAYTEKDLHTRPIRAVNGDNGHGISIRLKVTNSPAGKRLYSTIASDDPGEAQPTGLAQAIWTALNVLQYEGRYTMAEQDAGGKPAAMTDVGTQHKLNLSGGKAEWAAMNATVRGVEVDHARGTTAVTIGPARHLSAGDLEELMQVWKHRVVLENPALRTSGHVSEKSGQAGGHNSAENTTPSNPPQALHSTSFEQNATTHEATFITHDAGAEEIVLHRENNAGAEVSAAGSVSIALDDLLAAYAPAGGGAASVGFREIPICIGGVQKYMVVLGTEAYTH